MINNLVDIDLSTFLHFNGLKLKSHIIALMEGVTSHPLPPCIRPCAVCK